jgi:DNA-binding PadR family transcriptional regulator
MDPEQEPYEIAKDLTRLRYKTLAALQNLDGEARTSEITSSDDDLYHQLVNEHYSIMIPAGLIEKIDEGDPDEPGIPREGYKYRITDKGRAVLTAAQENYDLSPIGEGVVRRRFNDLEDELADHETRIKKLTEENEQLREEKDELEERFDKAVDGLRDMWDKVDELEDKVE